MTDLLSGAEAAAHAARLSQAFIPFAPSALSAEMADFFTKHNISVDEYESQSSAMNAAMGAAITGRRVFIPVAVESISEFYSASFQRLPIVAVNMSRCLGTYTIRSDISDIMLLRDAGWIIFLASNNQEVLDSILMANRISTETSLPSIINMNGIMLREPVAVPSDKKLLHFLPSRKEIDLNKPHAFNQPVDDYMEFKAQQQKAMSNALIAAEKTFAKWKDKFGRSYGTVEKYMLDDADYAFVVAGYNAGTCRAVVAGLRAQGEKVGMLRLHLLRPFPASTVAQVLNNVKKVAIIDEDISLGSSGIIYTELAQYYHGFACNFISLGRHIIEKDFTEIFQQLKKLDTPERMWLL